jgi:hypothetical protein
MNGVEVLGVLATYGWDDWVCLRNGLVSPIPFLILIESVCLVLIQEPLWILLYFIQLQLSLFPSLPTPVYTHCILFSKCLEMGQQDSRRGSYSSRLLRELFYAWALITLMLDIGMLRKPMFHSCLYLMGLNSLWHSCFPCGSHVPSLSA